MSIETTIGQEYIYRGRILNLRLDTVRLANGSEARREIVEHRAAVAIVPVDDKGRVLLVRQFRQATAQELLEIPAGVTKEGETPEETAQRELAEEAGLRAANLSYLAGFYTSPGFCDEYLHVFLATGLQPATAMPDADEDIAIIWLPLAEARAMIERCEIHDAKTIVGLLLAAQKA